MTLECKYNQIYERGVYGIPSSTAIALQYSLLYEIQYGWIGGLLKFKISQLL